MNGLEQLIVHRHQPKVKGWRGAGGRGLCKVCGKMKESEDFPTATGRVCKDCTTEVKRDRLGRFAAGGRAYANGIASDGALGEEASEG